MPVISETNQLDMEAEGIFVSSLCKSERIGLAMADQDGDVVLATEKFHEILETRAGLNLIGRNLIDIVKSLDLIYENTSLNSDNHEEFVQLIISAIREKKEGTISFTASTRTGKSIQFNNRITPYGRAIFCVRDISDERRYKDLLDMSMDAADAGFWAMRFDTGHFEYSESVMKRLSADEIVRMQKYGLFSIIHKDDLAKITRQWQGIISGTSPFDLRYRVVTEAQGEMWQRSLGKIQYGPDGKAIGATAFVMDITRDIERKAALEKEREVSKSKSEFLARMSHEIRTPLNAIIGMSDSLSEENLPNDIKAVVNDIEEAAEGLHDLLSSILDHAKLVSNKVEVELGEFQPRALIETCSKLWRPQIARKGLQFQVIVEPNVPDTLMLDGIKLKQCLNNLLSNAAKFTDDGKISIVMNMVKRKGQDNLVIAIRDSGIGMTESQAQKIFEPFSQVDGSISREFGGTGLGMNITKQLCELMGGQLHVRSEIGEGSTFMMLVPTQSVEASPDNKLQRAPNREKVSTSVIAEIGTTHLDKDMTKNTSTTKPFEGLSVLCVEDNMVNQRVVKRLIGNRVAKLYFANNGRDALNMLNTVNIDVVLMDIHMPVMDGIEATLEIRQSNQHYANVIIIALTADPDYQQRRICKNIGMDDAIAKPVRREDILNAFDRNFAKLSQSFGHKVALSA